MFHRIKRFLGAMDAARARLHEAGTSTVEVPSPFGGSASISSESDGEVRVSFSGLPSAVSRTYDRATRTRPTDYPQDLPFIEGATVSVVEIPPKGLRVVSWARLTRAGDLAREVASQMKEEGWVASPSRARLLGFLGSETEFRKGNAVRCLTLHDFPGRRPGLRLTERIGGSGAPESA